MSGTPSSISGSEFTESPILLSATPEQNSKGNLQNYAKLKESRCYLLMRGRRGKTDEQNGLEEFGKRPLKSRDENVFRLIKMSMKHWGSYAVRPAIDI